MLSTVPFGCLDGSIVDEDMQWVAKFLVLVHHLPDRPIGDGEPVDVVHVIVILDI